MIRPRWPLSAALQVPVSRSQTRRFWSLPSGPGLGRGAVQISRGGDEVRVADDSDRGITQVAFLPTQGGLFGGESGAHYMSADTSRLSSNLKLRTGPLWPLRWRDPCRPRRQLRLESEPTLKAAFQGAADSTAESSTGG